MTKMPFMRRKNTNEATKGSSNSSNHGFGATPDWKYGLNWMTLMGIGVAFLMGLSGLFSVTVVLQDIQSDTLWTWHGQGKGSNVVSVDHHSSLKDSSGQSSQTVVLDKDNLSGGHLAKELAGESQPLGLDNDNLSVNHLAKGIEKDSQSVKPDKNNPPSDPVTKEIKKDSQSVEPDKNNLPNNLLGSEHEKESQSVDLDKDNLLGGLLPSGFEKNSCFSRYQASLYRKELPHKPASSLISMLRSYEALHKRCGPHTESYKKVVELITTSQQLDNASDCNYLVWMSFSGLENRILSITSAFLYAILTNRVLLIDHASEIDNLFCEPFPGSSWLLPSDFPLLNQFDNFNKKSPLSFGNMLRNYIITDSTLTYPPYLYLHLANNYDNYDKLFFCDQDHSFLNKVPWLIMRTDNYFAPSLFQMSSFKKQLNDLFPRKDTVFHLLGRYLFYPTNSVWGLITRYYDTYLENADERVGIQIRVSDSDPGPSKHVPDQITACTTKEGLLPQQNEQEVASHGRKQKLKAVLLNSLSSEYYDSLKSMYYEKPTLSGEIVSFYQPNNNESQQTDNQKQNRKALAEMYLLSFTDFLVTSSGSTFGYVAQGLGGHKPWILYKPENETVPNPPCHRALSMEPCFHAAPSYLCKKKDGTDVGSLVPHVRHCEDMMLGLKLVDT